MLHMTRGRVFIVDDDEAMCRALDTGLVKRGFEISWNTSASEALEQIKANAPDVVLTDLNMPGLSGVELCDRLTAYLPDLPVIVITAFGSLDSAVAAIRAGSYDFVTKPFDLDAIALALDRAVRHRALHEEVRRLRKAVSGQGHGAELKGESAVMVDLLHLLARVAQTDASVLITGETGTGKELVARELRRISRRESGPFVAINCAALPEAILESELFGHARGAFTDAKSARDGLFKEAHGGTLFLDEIGDMPMSLQPKLLRALQERSIRPMGSNVEMPIDVRLITATNRDLETAVEDGIFRQDLLYRINVIQVHVPPLRARGNDVLILAQHFIALFASRFSKNVVGLTSPAAQKLLAYAWPGNVRELQNCMERAVALAMHDQITVEDLPENIRQYKPTQFVLESTNPNNVLPLADMERQYILKTLQLVGGNKALAARMLGVDRKTLYRKMGKYDGDE